MTTQATLWDDMTSAAGVERPGGQDRKSGYACNSAPVSAAMSGQVLRDKGIERVEAKGKEWLAEARRFAVSYCRVHGSVTADDVRVFYPLPGHLHPNTWGALFKDPRFIPIGDAQTTHPAGHARRVRRWGLRR